MFFEVCIVVYTYNKNQQNEHFSHQRFNVFILSSTCFEQPSVHLQEDLYMQFYGIDSCVRIRSRVDVRMCLIEPDCLYGCMKSTVKLHVQVFLKMNTWLFETCRRHYNLIKLLIKKCAFCWFLLHVYITMHRSKT